MKTQTFIVLLRGINVGGQKLIKMEALRRAFADAGLPDAITYIQSGNIIVSAPTSAEALKQKTRKLILDQFGFDVGVVVVDIEELEQAVANVQFEGPGNKVYLAFLSVIPKEPAIAAWRGLDTGKDLTLLRGRVLYVFYGDSAGTSKLTNSVVEKKLQVVSTMRNLNTSRKLVELARGL